ncbi:MAG: 2-hydroxyacid dehydrogenase [Cytophagaceae bacterium]
MKKVVVFSSKEYDKTSFGQLKQNQFSFEFISKPLDMVTVEMAKGAFAVCIFVNDHAEADIINKLKEFGVKGIAIRAAGYDQTDIKAAHDNGIHVANVPAYSPYAIAEHTVALALALNRQLIKANTRVKQNNFSIEGLTGFDMRGKTVGIVGLGKIGAITAKILNGFGCVLKGFDPMPNETVVKETGLTFVSLDELFSTSDIVVLQAPLNTHTKYILNKDAIDKMKPGVMVINTSRGGLMNTKDVLEGLKSNKIGYLGMDVYEKEKGVFFFDYSSNPPEDSVLQELLANDKVLVTSHMAFLTSNALKNIADTTLANLTAWADNKKSEQEL